MPSRYRRLTELAFCFGLWSLVSSCAVLHKVQLSDVESQTIHGKPVSIKVSQTTIDLRETARLAQGIGKQAGSKALSNAGNALETYTMLFQFGPRTGAPVYNEFYARGIPEQLSEECKSGYLSNITSVRETRSYPIVKGEIVRIDAYCFQP
ncbi:MAG: hypothetical protein NTX25_24125 [Proteobacteria bacterium]|nr:hypothetical protein [Pseudomonadota bacterium]